MKRLLVSGLPRIYQLARCFRAEEQGPWHEPEFTLLEWYRANGTWKETMSDTEELVRRIVEAARQAGFDRVPGLPEGPFLRLTVAEAFERYADGADALVLAARDEDEYYETLVQRVEPALAALGEPVFLTHYPLSQAALSRPCPESPHLAERYELYFQGVELCNGFGELTDSQQQRRRFEQERTRRSDAGEDCYPLDERFLGALEEGLLPCSGNALGVDRLIAVAAGAQALRDVLPFDSSEI